MTSANSFRNHGGALSRGDDHRPEARPSRDRFRSGAEAMIEGGLSVGEQVIVYPSDAVKEG
ncbi:MAG: hypothetical protein MPW17_04855 [Candidatus Manganitrophus sp.]|nr:MAG: hypothetical protein MPW17_04855 [Candidatus Manganitrophus sp.]